MIPKHSVKRIKNYVFMCSVVTSVSLGDGLEEIGAAAFMTCLRLQSIKIPNVVMAINDNAYIYFAQV